MSEHVSAGDADALAATTRAAQAGDATALEQLVLSVRDRVYRLSLRMTARPADAEDATQEILIRVITRLSTFRGESSARTWLLQIARYVCADHVRARTRRRSLVDRLVQRAAVEEATRYDDTGALDLDDLIARLDPDRREAFVLTQVAGLPYAEAALVCEVPIGTIRSRVARARADLLDAMAEGREVDSAT